MSSGGSARTNRPYEGFAGLLMAREAYKGFSQEHKDFSHEISQRAMTFQVWESIPSTVQVFKTL